MLCVVANGFARVSLSYRIIHSKWMLLIRSNKTSSSRIRMSGDAVVSFHQFVLLLYHKIYNERINNITVAFTQSLFSICGEWVEGKNVYGCFFSAAEKVSTCASPMLDWVKNDFIMITMNIDSCPFYFIYTFIVWIFQWAENYYHFFFRWRILIVLGSHYSKWPRSTRKCVCNAEWVCEWAGWWRKSIIQFDYLPFYATNTPFDGFVCVAYT